MKILFLTTKLFPLESGDALHSYGFLKRICAFNDVYIVTFIQEPLDTYYEHKNLFLKNNPVTGYYDIQPQPQTLLKKAWGLLKNNGITYKCEDPAIKKTLRSILEKKEINCVIYDHLRTTVYWKLINTYKKKPLLQVLNQHNVEWANARTIGRSQEKKWLKVLYSLEAKRIQKFEKKTMKKADIVLAISQDDKNYFKKLTSNSIPLFVNRPHISFPRLKFAGDLNHFRKRLLFVGSMRWQPNINGVKWFVEQVFSKLIELDNEYRFYIVGNRPTPSIEKMAKEFYPNVIITGRVKNLKYFYQKCDLAVIPLKEGTGAKIKVLESLASGIPTLLSSFCAKDYQLSDEALICDSADDYLQGILRLQKCAELREQLLQRSTTFYQNYMTSSRNQDSFLKIFTEKENQFTHLSQENP